MVAIQALSLGHALDVQTACTGAVHSVFPRAVNLEIGGELWTLLTAGRDDLPFGIRVARGAFDTLGLRRGDRVDVRAGHVGIGERVVVDCRMAARWTPARGCRPAPGLHRRLETVAGPAAARAWSGSAGMAWAVVCALERPDALREVLPRVAGCGAGSTPAGDDVLIGILAVLTSGHANARAAAAVRALDDAMRPLLATTPDISRHLLRQAVRGYVSRCVHELLDALTAASRPEALRQAVQRVLDGGATSGADLCTGLLAAAPAYLGSAEERAAA